MLVFDGILISQNLSVKREQMSFIKILNATYVNNQALKKVGLTKRKRIFRFVDNFPWIILITLVKFGSKTYRPNRFMIYLLTAIGLTPGGSSTVHIYTQTIHRTTQNKQYIDEHNNLWECGPCPVLARFTLAFALQLRKKHGKTSVRVAASTNT